MLRQTLYHGLSNGVGFLWAVAGLVTACSSDQNATPGGEPPASGESSEPSGITSTTTNGPNVSVGPQPSSADTAQPSNVSPGNETPNAGTEPSLSTDTSGSANENTLDSQDTSGTPSPSTEVPSGPCAMPSTLVSRLDTTAIAEMGTPFDADEEDTIGPADWNSNYGKTPEIIPYSSGSGGIDVLWRDTASENQAFVVHVEASDAGSYAVTRAYRVETLGQLMGFTRDAEGNYYYATGVDEDDQITTEYPAEGEFRQNIVKLVKFDAAGCVAWETDVDSARGAADSEAEPIVNPMVAGTSRLAWGGDQLALVHSINTAPDDNDVRHQKALTTHFNALDGAISRTSGLWVSHSFDQRVAWNGEGFIDLHLGDAYPRSIVMSLSTADDETEGYELYFPKGEQGDNATYTQLGALVEVPTGDFGYWVFFATDRSPELATEDWQGLVGTRDVALARVRRDFATGRPADGGFLEETGTVHSVTSGGATVDNSLRWVTDLGAGGQEVHAGRVRAVAAAGERVTVMWEQWQPGGRSETFDGTFALELDADAEITTAAAKISDRHIPRGDDAFVVDGHAALVLGNAQERTLTLQLVGGGLEVNAVVLP